ncbi:MAG: collagen binding domain-containing protein [Collinsella sp.]
MLYVLPAVSVSFQKQSSKADITAGNGIYKLDGATFDIFENAGDARVGTIQTDENGRAQATLLPNTAYYLVETKAPAGYIPRSDRIAFTTRKQWRACHCQRAARRHHLAYCKSRCRHGCRHPGWGVACGR